MKLKPLLLLALSASTLAVSSQSKQLDIAQQHVERMVNQMDSFSEIKSPRTLAKDGTSTQYTTLQDWTSGFFPGTLWYLYELSGDKKWLSPAIKYTEGMEHIKHYTGNHDIGFMIFCSFGNGLRLSGKESYKDVIITAAKTLTTRFRPDAGIIQSWNKQRNWECPVIIDNMMNLELLFEATKMSGDSTYWKVATSHADQTIKNHYRPDMSCWHVVDYDPTNGNVRAKQTAQGYSDESSWSRGQAWGLYGYTLCYRYTKDSRYLEQAQKIANYLFAHPNMPKDLVPYWDFDAPTPATTGKYPKLGEQNPRDASAAAIIASALYELQKYSPKQSKQYIKWADKIVASLNSPTYTAPVGTNGNFILMHSTGSIPHNVEIDKPLVYADYYLLEAIKRKLDLKK